jgi:hypothetical protein
MDVWINGLWTTDFWVTDFWVTDFWVTDFWVTDFWVTDPGCPARWIPEPPRCQFTVSQPQC